MEASAIRKKIGEYLINVLKDKNEQIAKILIEGGADINIDKDFIIKKLITYNYIDLLKILEKELCKTGGNKDNASNQIIESNKKNNQICENYLLLSIGLNKTEISKYLINLKKDDGTYVFDIKKGKEFLVALENDNDELIKIFIERDIDFNVTNEFGENAIYLCLKNKNYEMAKLLLSQKDSIGKPKILINNNAANILKNRIANDDINGIKILLEYGIDVNSYDKDNIPPIVHCIQFKKYDIAKLIIQYRPKNKPLPCNINIMDGYILNDAINRNDVEFVSFLLENGADPTIKNLLALDLAISKKNTTLIKLLVDHINKHFF